MKRLNKNEMLEIKGGTNLSSSMLNAIMRDVSGMFAIGQAVGSAIRRITNKSYC